MYRGGPPQGPPSAGEKFMKKLVGSRKFLTGTAFAAVIAGLSGGALVMDRGGAAPAQPAGDPMVSLFEGDPFLPQPLPNPRVLAIIIGPSMDAKDNDSDVPPTQNPGLQ